MDKSTDRLQTNAFLGLATISSTGLWMLFASWSIYSVRGARHMSWLMILYSAVVYSKPSWRNGASSNIFSVHMFHHGVGSRRDVTGHLNKLLWGRGMQYKKLCIGTVQHRKIRPQALLHLPTIYFYEIRLKGIDAVPSPKPTTKMHSS